MARAPHPTRFWRAQHMPWLEARLTIDARDVSYGRHSHDTFSLGAVLGGRSLYRYWVAGREHAVTVSQGMTVAMNPGEVHACNPCGDTPWSYLMLHVDPGWLAARQPGAAPFQPVETRSSRDPALYAALVGLSRTLFDGRATPQVCQRRGEATLMRAMSCLAGQAPQQVPENERLAGVATYIRAHCLTPITLEEMAQVADCSVSWLIRAFRRRYGLTPHAFLNDCRIRHGQCALRQGAAIAEVALDCRFADQAHFQRTFKRLTAATPQQYRRPASCPAPER